MILQNKSESIYDGVSPEGVLQLPKCPEEQDFENNEEYVNAKKTRDDKYNELLDNWFVEITEDDFVNAAYSNNDKVIENVSVKDMIVSKYSIEEQLNVMRETLVNICKKNKIDDWELFNMHNHISKCLWRWENE